jgi:translation initiation factor eIF-2B subunit epsilon
MENIDYSQVRDPEYQVVLIVDIDDGRMYPLTEDRPKCLLPIANRKLLSYQLDMLAQSGIISKFTTILIILMLINYYIFCYYEKCIVFF